MPDQNFYVGAEDQRTHKITGYVPSKFLMRNGAYILDPIPGASQQANVYSDNFGNNQTDGRVANPNNYLIVPANYSEQHAKDFSTYLAAAQTIGGPSAALPLMAYAFWPDGPEELQRNPRWGIPPNSYVRAYKSAASDHFGYVTGAAGLPQELAEFGGGVHNLLSKATSKPDVDTSGKDGLSKVNEANIAQGYAAGLAARNSPSPFDGYGAGTASQSTASEIGEGNSISPFAPTTGSADDLPAPSWPPGQSSPVRYVGSRIVQY